MRLYGFYNLWVEDVFQRFFARSRGDDVLSKICQYRLIDQQLVGLVIHDQNVNLSVIVRDRAAITHCQRRHACFDIFNFDCLGGVVQHAISGSCARSMRATFFIGSRRLRIAR